MTRFSTSNLPQFYVILLFCYPASLSPLDASSIFFHFFAKLFGEWQMFIVSLQLI